MMGSCDGIMRNILLSRHIKITVVEAPRLQYTYYFLLGNLQ